MERETPPPFMEKCILNFHFNYWNPSLTYTYVQKVYGRGLNELALVTPYTGGDCFGHC